MVNGESRTKPSLSADASSLHQLLFLLPITSCECERSISALRNLKNYKRSTMVEERLNGLALMGIHTEVVPDVEKIIDKFAQGNTRLKFL